MIHPFEWTLRVYYEDTDAGGLVYHSRYLNFMERARTEWLTALGVDHHLLRGKYHSLLVVRKITIDYLKPAILGDYLQIHTQLVHLGKVTMTLQQTVVRQTIPLCTATVKLACVQASNLRPQSIPPIFKGEPTVLTDLTSPDLSTPLSPFTKDPHV